MVAGKVVRTALIHTKGLQTSPAPPEHRQQLPGRVAGQEASVIEAAAAVDVVCAVDAAVAAHVGAGPVEVVAVAVAIIRRMGGWARRSTELLLWLAVMLGWRR